MNIVALIGNVASEPRREETSNGGIVSFRLAVARPGSEYADFFTINVEGEQRQSAVQQYLTVGRRVSVQGRIMDHGAVSVDRHNGMRAATILGNQIDLLGSAR